jgi:hypothetical protein
MSLQLTCRPISRHLATPGKPSNPLTGHIAIVPRLRREPVAKSRTPSLLPTVFFVPYSTLQRSVAVQGLPPFPVSMSLLWLSQVGFQALKRCCVVSSQEEPVHVRLD